MINLPLAQLRKGEQLRANCSILYTKSNLTPVCSSVLVDFKGQDDSCVVLGGLHSSFGLFCKIKEADNRHPYTPPHSIIELTIVILTQMLYCR